MEALTVKQVADQLQVGKQKVHLWIKEGVLPAVNVNRPGAARPRYRILQRDLDRFLEGSKVTQVYTRPNVPDILGGATASVGTNLDSTPRRTALKKQAARLPP